MEFAILFERNGCAFQTEQPLSAEVHERKDVEPPRTSPIEKNTHQENKNMTHLVQRHWAVDVYQVFFWLSTWASFPVLGHPAIRCDSWGGGQGIASYDRKINFLPTPWHWRCGHMASAQTTESSQKSSESQVTDTLKDTIALDVQGAPYIAWVLAELSATGEVTEGAVFSGCPAGGWVEDHQGVQLHSFPSGLLLLLPSPLGFLAFCWFYKLLASLSINSSHYALIIQS